DRVARLQRATRRAVALFQRDVALADAVAVLDRRLDAGGQSPAPFDVELDLGVPAVDDVDRLDLPDPHARDADVVVGDDHRRVGEPGLVRRGVPEVHVRDADREHAGQHHRHGDEHPELDQWCGESTHYSTVTSAPRYIGAMSSAPQPGTSSASMPICGPVSCEIRRSSPGEPAGSPALRPGAAEPPPVLYPPASAMLFAGLRPSLTERAGGGAVLPSCTGPSGGYCGNGSGRSAKS